MKPGIHALVAGVAACLLLACQPAPPAKVAGTEASPTLSTIPEPMPAALPVPEAVSTGGGTDAVQVADATSPAGDPEFDARTFAGRYADTGQTLDIESSGSYRLLAGDGAAVATGTWSLQADGTHVLLDPDSKSEADRRLALHGDGSLHDVDGDAVLLRARD